MGYVLLHLLTKFVAALHRSWLPRHTVPDAERGEYRLQVAGAVNGWFQPLRVSAIQWWWCIIIAMRSIPAGGELGAPLGSRRAPDRGAKRARKLGPA